MSVSNVLGLIGWGFLVLSWIVPYIMRKRNGKLSAKGDSYVIGMILAAFASGIFLSALVVNLMK